MICHWEFFWKRWNFLALNFRLLISCCPKKITLWLSLMRIQLHWVEFSEKLYYPIIFCVYILEIIFELIKNQFRIIWGWNYVTLKKQNLTIQGHIENTFHQEKIWRSWSFLPRAQIWRDLRSCWDFLKTTLMENLMKRFISCWVLVNKSNGIASQFCDSFNPF